MLDKIKVGSLGIGDSIKYISNGNELPDGVALQMENNTLVNMELNKDKSALELSIVNTMLEDEESVISNLNKDQLTKLIRDLKDLYKQMFQKGFNTHAEISLSQIKDSEITDKVKYTKDMVAEMKMLCFKDSIYEAVKSEVEDMKSRETKFEDLNVDRDSEEF